MKTLTLTTKIKIRFSDIDAVRIVWHGVYAQYFEDARELFGEKYGISYTGMEQEGFYAPLVELKFNYRQPLRYGMEPELIITYIPTEAAKILFDYQIRDSKTKEILASGHSVQVFVDLDYNLVCINPPFYEKWKDKWLNE